MTISRNVGVAVLVLLPFWIAVPVSGSVQPRKGMAMYDKRAEVTVNGTVEEVREMTGMSGMADGSMRGMHLMLKTDKETFEVHPGPVSYLKEQKVDLAKGDTIEVSIPDVDAAECRRPAALESGAILMPREPLTRAPLPGAD